MARQAKPRKPKLRSFDRRHGRLERKYGSDAFRMVLGLYASKKAMSAKDFCLLSYFIGQCGTPGNWKDYGRPPGLQSGKYKAHLDTLLPSAGPYYAASIPCSNRKNPLVKSKEILFRSVITVLSDEIANDEGCQRFMAGADQGNPCSPGATQAYKEHPKVIESVQKNGVFPIPLAVYCDGVRITPVSAGRIDNVGLPSRLPLANVEKITGHRVFATLSTHVLKKPAVLGKQIVRFISMLPIW
jgi:hypothetical protein